MAEKWTDEEEEQLIEMWRERPNLYDISCKSYSNRIKKNASYEEIASRLEKPVSAIVNQIKNLRTQNSRLIKCPPSGSERRTRTARQTWIVEQMVFLRPHLKSRDSVASANFETETESISLDDSYASQQNELDAPQIEAESTDQPERPSSPTPSQLSQESDISRISFRDGPNKRQTQLKRKRDTEILESIARSLSKPIEIKDAPEPDDEDDLFGRLIASKLKKVSNPVIKSNLTSRILQLLSEAQAEEFNQNSQRPVSESYLTMLNSTGSFTY